MILRGFTVLLIFSASVSLMSCGNIGNKNKESGNSDSLQSSTSPAIQSEPVDGFRIRRYEVALFELNRNELAGELKKLQPEFSIFLGDGNFSQADIRQINDFVSDANNREAYNMVMKKFPDLKKLTLQLKNAFDNYSRETGQELQPKTYTYVSGYDFQYPVKYADSVMIIGLDLFLGRDFDMYKKMGVPLYISNRFTPDHIVPDCVKEMAYPLIPEKQGTYNLLEAMIEQGKLMYFTSRILPDVSKYLIIGFEPEQLSWCKDNEGNLWQFIIENELLYSSDSKAMSMFMVDGPFTSSFSDQSPARTGVWLGWQIVESYMKRNKVSLITMMANTNSREILEKSGYKPARK